MARCDLCGKEAIMGQTTPYNPIKKWYYLKPKYKVIWLCFDHMMIFPMMKKKAVGKTNSK